jgi:copper oxidase (laccase) domain-containing protein
MQESFGTSKEELYIVLGPSIGGCCYEINETIALECAQKGYSKALRREKDKVFLTVNTILLQQLDALDIQQERIEVIEHCTACKNDEYFSYRADTQQTGRIAGLILLR